MLVFIIIRLSLLICHKANCQSYYLKISRALQTRHRAVVEAIGSVLLRQ